MSASASSETPQIPQRSTPGDPFFHVRRAQTRSKHDLLGRYAGAWAGIILTGLAARQRKGRLPIGHEVDLVYIDGFAGAGRYSRDADKPDPGPDDPPIWGSPVLALQAIEGEALRYPDLKVRVTGVCIEEDPDKFGTYDDLLVSLQAAGLRTPIVPQDHGAIRCGEITAIKGDFRQVLPEVLESIPKLAKLLAFIDPFGPIVPMELTTRIVGRRRTDAIVFFPYGDLVRKGGSVRTPEDEREAHAKANVTRNDSHFGTSEWQEIYLDPNLGDEQREQAFVHLFLRQLHAADPALVVKKEGLRSPRDRSRTAYYLCMGTRDANGALKLNELIRQTAAKEDLEIWRDDEEWLRRRDEDAGQGTLMLPGYVPRPPDERDFSQDTQKVIAALERRCGDGRTRAMKEVLLAMGEDVFTEGEVMKALRSMRRDGRAQFDHERVDAAVVIRKP